MGADLSVFVVLNEQTGLWDAACCNDQCGYGVHEVSDDNSSKAAAERAATRHRTVIRKLIAERANRDHGPGRTDWEVRALAAEETLTRVRELAQQWRTAPLAYGKPPTPGHIWRRAGGALLAALDVPADGEQPPTPATEEGNRRG